MRVRIGVALVAFAVAVSGCGGSGSGTHRSTGAPASRVPLSQRPGTSSPAAPTAPTVPADVPTTGPNLLSADEKPPVMPLAATEHTADGAVAFAKFFIQTIDWGYATTNATYMTHYFLPDCVTCMSIRDGLANAAARQRRFIGNRLAIRSLALETPGVEPEVRVEFDATSAEVVDGQGKFVNAAPAMSFKNRLTLHWDGHAWLVSALLALQ